LPRKIAIIGTAGSGIAAPYDDPSWEIWGVAGRNAFVTRADRWFELHRLDGEHPDFRDHWRGRIPTVMEDVAVLYMIWPEEDLAPGKVKRFPVEPLIERFGTFFMTSSFAWMFAMAIDEICPIVDGRVTLAEPGTEIFLCGVDMEYDTEYRCQRAGARHFMELSKTLGIKVTRVADGGLAMEPVPYPMWQDDPLLNKAEARAAEVRKDLDARSKTLRSMHEVVANIRGALGELKLQYEQPDYNRDARADTLELQLDANLKSIEELSKDVTTLEGHSEELGWLLDYLKP
jgi:hypothetical protein